MNLINRSLIDNWSIEQSYEVLTEDLNRFTYDANSLLQHIGGLANLINSMLLYDDTLYLENGNHRFWKTSFDKIEPEFSKILIPASSFETPLIKTIQNPLPDNGAHHYLINSKKYDADLFVSTERSNSLLLNGAPPVTSDFIEALKSIDHQIEQELDYIWLKKVKLGIKNNFLVPSLTHYVLSESSNQNDVLKVLMELKRSDKISKIKNHLHETSMNLRDYSKFQDYLSEAIKYNFNKRTSNQLKFSVRINLIFMSISKGTDLNYRPFKPNFVLLKDIITCRTEVNGLMNHLQRVFNLNKESFNKLINTNSSHLELKKGWNKYPDNPTI